jgi:signal transduction histidine kinase
MEESAYNEILIEHLQTLPEEKERILRADLSPAQINEIVPGVPAEFIQEILTEGYKQTKLDGTFYAGMHYQDNEGDFIILVSARDNSGVAQMRRLLNILILCFLSGLVLTYFVGIFYSGRVLSPISSITERANEISATNLHLRLDVSNTRDELDELATTFNHMLDRLGTSFETQNNFINNASHELRNPLTAILGETEIALNKERSPEEYRHALQTVQKEAQRLDLIVNSLLKLAQTGMEDKRLIISPIRIDELLMEVKQHLDSIRPANQVKFDFSELPEKADFLLIQGNESLLTVALNNILDNACKFSDDKEVTVKIKADKKRACISVTDRGVGIPASDIPKITEPFFRADNARAYRGFGVGLPLTHKIVKIHGGTVTIHSEVNQGTRVILEFPNYRFHKKNLLDLSVI